MVCIPGSQQILKLTIFVGYEYDLDEESNHLVMTNKKMYVILNADVFTQMHEDIIPRAPFLIKWKVQENSFSEDFPDEIECTWHSLHKFVKIVDEPLSPPVTRNVDAIVINAIAKNYFSTQMIQSYLLSC